MNPHIKEFYTYMYSTKYPTPDIKLSVSPGGGTRIDLLFDGTQYNSSVSFWVMKDKFIAHWLM